MEKRNIFHAFMKVLMHASTVRFVLIMERVYWSCHTCSAHHIVCTACNVEKIIGE